MKYEVIDPTTAVDGLLAEHAIRADGAALAATIDIAKVDFVQAVRAVDGKDPDPELEAFATIAAATKEASEEKCEERCARMATRMDAQMLAECRREQLGAWLRAWEAEHAQHGILIELAESPEQVEASTLAQLVIEGAVLGARKELAEVEAQLR